MTTLQLLIVCVAGIIALALIAGTAAGAGRNTIKRGQPVTVHTKQPDDQTLHGVLMDEHSDRLVLQAARYVTSAGDQPIPDTVVVLKANVAWLQLHPNTEA